MANDKCQFFTPAINKTVIPMFHEKPCVSRFTDDTKDASINLLLDVSLEKSVSYRINGGVYK